MRISDWMSDVCSSDLAGDAGRMAAEACEVLLHGAFSAHRDRISAKRTVVLDLPLPFDGRDWPARARIADPDRLVRLCERDPVEAVAALLGELVPAPGDEEDDLRAEGGRGGEGGVGQWRDWVSADHI